MTRPRSGLDIDRLLLAIVQRQDADATIQALNHAGLTVTVIASVGHYLGASNATLLVGLPAGDVEMALDVLKASGHHRTVHTPREAEVGGATVFVIPVARHLHLCAPLPAAIPPRAAVEPGLMSMIFAIVSQAQSDQILKTLTDWSYRGTLLSTTGGFSHRRNAAVLIGARSERVDSIVELIRQVCEQDSREDSAATIFVLEGAQHERM